MIARVWRGHTARGDADAYQGMLTPELLPGLSSVKGFRGSYLLRRDDGNEVEFITVILMDSLDDLRAFAGPDYQRSIIPEERKKYLIRHDETAAHYEVVASQ